MLVGCSEINISIIVKHVQHIGIAMAFLSAGGAYYISQSLGRQKNLLVCASLMGSVPRLTLCILCIKCGILLTEKFSRSQ